MKLETKLGLLVTSGIFLGAIIGAHAGFNYCYKQALTDLEARHKCEEQKAVILKSLNNCYRDNTQLFNDTVENTIEGRGRLTEGEINIQVFINDFFNSNSEAEIVCFGRGWVSSEEKELD